MDYKIENISREETLRDMHGWELCSYRCLEDFDTLWRMFRAVINSSSYGTSEFGGPVWLMDFSLANLKKLYPDNPWLTTIEQEWSKGKWDFNGQAKSDKLNLFSKWFELRANRLITELGLGNVIVKYESTWDNICLYGWGTFLDVVRSLANGEVMRPSKAGMVKSNFSLRESEFVRKGKFFTRLGGCHLYPAFPSSYGSDRHYWKHSDVYGDCYLLNHFSLTRDYVVTETVKEKFLMLIVNDLMDAIALGHGKPDGEGTVCPYPKMKFEQYLDDGYCFCDNHFKPTSNVFMWQRPNGLFEKIEIKLPEINAEHGEFWHRQFLPKQPWRVGVKLDY